MRSLCGSAACAQTPRAKDRADHAGDRTWILSLWHACPHLNDVISAILAVDGLDGADVQAAKHF